MIKPLFHFLAVTGALSVDGVLEAQFYTHQYSIYDTAATAVNAKLGWSMAVSGNRLAVGAPHFAAQYGRVSILTLGDVEQAQLWAYAQDVQVNGNGSNPFQQRFGASLAMDDNWMMVGNCSSYGSSLHCNSDADRVLVFLNTGDTVQAYQSIERPLWASGGAFGRAIALEGDVCAIGGANRAVYIYRFISGLWQLSDSLSDDQDQVGSTSDFGHALDMDNGVLVVGAGRDDELGFDCGAAYLYTQDLNSDGHWTLIRKLLASNGTIGDHFGTAVALQDDICVVGAPKRRIGAVGEEVSAGSAYVFDRNAGFVGNWGETAYLEPIGVDSAGMDFGASLAIGSNRIAVGAPLHTLSSRGYDGSVHVFRSSGVNWLEVQRIEPNLDGLVSDSARSGTSLAFYGEYLMIGAPVAIVQNLSQPATSPTGMVLVYAEGPVSMSERDTNSASLWPNPFSDRVYFVAPDRGNGPVRVLDVQGRVVRILGPVVHGTNTWDLGGLEAGPYYIQVDLLNGDRVTRPVIRQ